MNGSIKARFECAEEMISNGMHHKKDYILPIVLFLSSSVVIFWKLGDGSLAMWDESEYAEISKNILRTGDWITLYWQSGLSPDFHIPPLYAWLTAITYKIFGINEFSARFWSAIFGISCIITTYLLGKELYNRYVGFIASVILLTSPQFLDWSRRAMLDVPLTFFITLAILSFWIGYRKNNKYFILSGVSIGLGFMTKGVAGIIPILIILLFAILSTDLKVLRNKNTLKGIFAIIAVAAPWHISQLILHGKKFFDKYFMYHVIKRSEQAIEGHVGTDFYYFDILKKGFQPYSFFILFAVLYNAKAVIEEKKREDILILSWIVVVLGIFTLAQSKLPWYIIPIYPALSISGAQFLYKFIEKEDALIYTGIFISLALWLSLSCQNITMILPVKSVLIGGVAITAIIFAIHIFIKKAQNYNRIVPFLIVFVLLISTIHLPDAPDYSRDIKAVTSSMKIVSESNDTLYLYTISFPAPLFYSDRKVSYIRDKNKLKQILNNSKTAFVLIKAGAAADIGNDYKIVSKSGDIMLIANNRSIPIAYMSSAPLGRSSSPDTPWVAITNITPSNTSHKPNENMTVEITLKNLDKIKHNASAWWFLDPPGGESPWKEPVIASKHLQMYLDPDEERTISITSKVPNKEGTYDLSAWVHVRIDGKGKHSDGAWHINTIAMVPGET